MSKRLHLLLVALFLVQATTASLNQFPVELTVSEDSTTDSPIVYHTAARNNSTNNSGQYNGSISIVANGNTFYVGDTITATIESDNLDIGVDYTVNWAQSNGGSGTYSWTSTAVNHIHQEFFTPSSAGTFCMDADLYFVQSTSTTWIDSDQVCVKVTNNTGGNNTGGNNTGGNTTGNNTSGNNTGGNTTGNNTGGNNTGGNTTGNNTGNNLSNNTGNNTGNSTGNNTGGNTTGNNTIGPCGVDPTLASVWTWTDAQTYQTGDSQSISLFVNCTRVGGQYQLTYRISEVGTSPPVYVHSQTWTWTATTYWMSFTDTVSNLQPGDYCILAKLYESNVYVTDNGGNTCFTILGAPNSPPDVSNVQITPTSPTNLDVLTCAYTYTDAENDPDQSLVTWTITSGGVSTTSTVTTLTLNSGYNSGEFVTCTIVAHDGTQIGNTGSHTVLILTQSGGPNGGAAVPSVGLFGTLAMLGISVLVAGRKRV
jgi:hypothetical protein